MEPKEYKRPSALHISSPSFFNLPAIDDEDPEDADSSSSSSPGAFAGSPPTSATPSLPTPSATDSTSTSPKSKEKRKRSRVTPDQLVHLERFFALDRSPTAARRREISELLRMNERQTQIWFQNRRAKAKLLETKKQLQHQLHHNQHHSLQHMVLESPPDTPPQLSAGFERDLHDLIQEPEPITIIPCTDLSIGTWRRIASATTRHDLVAYFSPSRRCLTWFIHSAGYGFKMELPYSSIVRTELQPLAPSTPHAPGNAIASFYLSRPPVFSLEQSGSWRKCQDWTEGTQASSVLKHDLIGNATTLAHVLSLLIPSAIDVPITPVSSSSALFPPVLQSASAAVPRRPDHMLHGRKRSFSGPPALDHVSNLGAAASMYHHQHAPYDTSSFQLPPPPTSYTPPALGPSGGDDDIMPISQLAAPRPYTAPSRLLQPHQFALHSAPPSLLTSPFQPTPSPLTAEGGESSYTTSLAGALGGPLQHP